MIPILKADPSGWGHPFLGFLERPMALTYSQQLADPRWQRRRLERLHVAQFQCDNCGCDSEQLHVHHRHYFKWRKAWEYSDHELRVLCKSCHDSHHKFDDALKVALSGSEMGDELYSGLLAGFLEAGMDMDVEGAGLLDATCPDGILTGRMAYMFFNAHRNDKARIAEILLAADTRRSPIEEETLRMFAELYRA